MGETVEADCPMSEATRDSLELCVCLNIQLKSRKATDAMLNPATAEIGALTQTFFVASIRLRIKPQAPNAVTKQASTVGLKNERPGTPLWSYPASAWPPGPDVRLAVVPAKKVTRNRADDREQQTKCEASRVDNHRFLTRFIAAIKMSSQQPIKHETWLSVCQQ